MLAFLMTDARVHAYVLTQILGDAVEESFNCISVEGHMSTNDSVLLLASGAASQEPLAGDDLSLSLRLRLTGALTAGVGLIAIMAAVGALFPAVGHTIGSLNVPVARPSQNSAFGEKPAPTELSRELGALRHEKSPLTNTSNHS